MLRVATLQSVDTSPTQLLQLWGWRNPSATLRAFAQTAAPHINRRVGEIVVALELMTENELHQAIADQPERVPLMEHLIKVKPPIGNMAGKVLAIHDGIAFYDEFNPQLVHPDYRQNPDIATACNKMHAVLLQTDTNQPVLAFNEYSNLNDYRSLGRPGKATDPLHKKYGKPLLLALAAQRFLMQAGAQTAAAVTLGADNHRDQINYWASSSADSESLRILGQILDTAVEMKVTDVAIEPVSGGTGIVQYREHGDLITVRNDLPGSTLVEISRFLMSRSRANPQNARLRQPADGQITYGAPAGNVFIRCSFIPVDIGLPQFEGVSCALRLLTQTARRITLPSLHLAQTAINDIRDAVNLSSGIILMVGPTGSGKSTTIAGMLDLHTEIYGDTKKRLSIEDPIERYLTGIRQFPINEGQVDKDHAFSKAIKAFLRHDPDLIWVGEVRDREAAMAATRAANTGHLVLTTFHANDTVMGYKELADMLDASRTVNLIEALSLILSQRLVKRLCHCSLHTTPTPDDIIRFNSYIKSQGVYLELPQKLKCRNPTGCPDCKHTGIRDRIPIVESLPVTRALKDTMCDFVASRSFRYSDVAQHRTTSLLSAAVDLVRAGHIELGEIYSK